ncbi:MAG TPA: porin family protein [Luteibaculaceae bacterium]|nr:porin family protein [Luteibaculaceae bacterium]
MTKPRSTNRLSLLIAAIGFLLLCTTAEAQEEKRKYYNLNLPNFDLREYHFGFIIGINQSDFIVNRKLDSTAQYRIKELNNRRLPGFNLGIVSNYRLNKNVHFRFVPTLSFQDRQLVYTFDAGPNRMGADSSVTFTKVVEATFVEFPLYVKLRTDRIGNAAVYAIAGGKYMLDMSSKKLDDLVADKDVLVRINKSQFGLEFGGGADFFLPYFKFGIDLKMTLGIGNVLIDDNTRFSRPLNGLITKGYILTFTFEG